jgi:endonuclease YncB( thermonuclease family)
MNPVKWSSCLFVAVLAVCTACSWPTTGGGHTWHLVKVIDGDTVDVSNGSRAMRIRTACIDAPELHQPQGQRSARALEADLQGKDIGIETDGRDRYGRTVAYLIVDGENVNLAMVEAGMAFVYPNCKRKEFYAAETAARTAHAGVWADEDPQRPWDYRRAQRNDR